MWVGEARVSITDLERTLLDGLSMPQHCGGFAEALHAFQLGMTTAKRLGWALESQGGPPV